MFPIPLSRLFDSPTPNTPLFTVHVVTHTHWDREWYHPAERFRQRLVALIDELLDAPANGASFLLDGQTIVLEDYLDVRPERASDVAQALREGRLEAGPWFVLADELIPSGEALVRNLLAGRRTLRALRAAAPAALYCPDSFGHPAALPALALGFDLPVIVLWRGYGGARAPRGRVVWWSAPGAERALVYHLSRSGYELGANLPDEREAAVARWTGIRDELADKDGRGLALLLNGADHHARQRDLGPALRVLAEVAAPDQVRSGRLAEFARDLISQSGARELPSITGELRDSYGYTWTLQGTLASRAPQKRRYAISERKLLRDVEPWTAFAALYAGHQRRSLTRAAWRSLLLCQPHDTLCGCSIDQVARAMDHRLETAMAQAEGLREDAILDLVGHDRDASRSAQARWRSLALVRNRAARPRAGVAIVEFVVKLADVSVGPGSTHVAIDAAKLRRLSHPSWPVQPVQLLDVHAEHQRTESPRHYPDDDTVVRFSSAVWITAAPAYGVLAVPLEERETSPAWLEERVTVRDAVMSNGRLILRWDRKGRLRLEDMREHRVVRGLIEWESRHDAGDLYTPSLRGSKLVARFMGTRVLHRGPLHGVVEQRWRLARAGERVDVSLQFILDAGANWLRVHVRGDNQARDHRLRLRIRSDVRGGVTVADAAFGPIERKLPKLSRDDSRMEKLIATAPLQRYVSRFDAKRGATLFSDGLTEYEALEDGFAVTLVRAIGELSRSDLPERPGHAGWPAPTPEAQCPGPFEAELALMLHGPRSAATVDEIERAADDVLFPLTGETLRSAIHVPSPVFGVALEGIGLAFSCVKESEEGEWTVLRCVNLLDQECAGSWKLGRPVREAQLARLDEMPLTPLQPRGDSIPFLAPPRGIVTILVK